MTKKKSFLKMWVQSLFHALAITLLLLTYWRIRDWFIPKVDNIWIVGFFEGVVAMIIIYYYVDKYGNAIHESYHGLRELGQQRIARQDKE